ncbi:hypothetical protein DXG01_004748 [Tephrocybe rancida]|nr:hypothetical protein DXG01_004748 [Tephrocybe rancida]
MLLYLMSILGFLPLLANSLILKKPIPGAGNSDITSNGTALVSWVVEANDPAFITFEIQNNVTLDSWEFATNVDVSLGNITRSLEDVGGNDSYFMQAVQVGNLLNVLAESPLFTVVGTPVVITNTPSSTSTSTSKSTSALPVSFTSVSGSLTSPSSPPTSATPAATSTVPNGANRKGPIIGGLVGGITLVLVASA